MHNFSINITLKLYDKCSSIGYPASVDGSSMCPTINEDKSFCSDWVFVNCWTARDLTISSGDIVVFNSPVGKLNLNLKLKLIYVCGTTFLSF
jgi:signal peptidase I